MTQVFADVPTADEPGSDMLGAGVVRVVGAGRARWLEELARTARRDGMVVIHVRAAEATRLVPFGALRDALRGVDAAAPQNALLLLSAVLHASLDRGACVFTAVERHRVHRTAADLVESIARPSGLLVAVDQAHHADPATLELLDHLFRHPPTARVVVAVADDHKLRLPADTHLVEAPGPRERHPHTPPRPPATLEELLAAAEVSARIAPAVTAHHLDRALRLVPRDAVPARQRLLRGLVAATHAAGRTHDHRRAVRDLLALCPPDRAEIALRCALADRAQGRHADANALLEREHRDLGDRRGRLLLEVALAADPAAGRTRADLAVRAARRLADPALLVAALAVRLGKPVDRRTPHLLDEAVALADATDCAPEALLWLGRAETALERPADALRHLDRAARLAREQDRGDVLGDLAQARGEALEHLGRLADAAECYRDAAETHRTTGASDALAPAGLARVAVWRGEVAEGLRLAEQAVAASPEFPAHHALGLAALHSNDPGRCVEHLLGAGGSLDLPLVDPLATVEWCALLALADSARNRAADALRWAEYARSLVAEFPGRLRHGFARLAHAAALRHTDPAAAATAAAQAADLLEKAGHPVQAGRARVVAAALFRQTDRPDRERRELDQARALLDACEPGLFDRVGTSWAGAVPDHGLTEREHKVLTVLAQGLTAEAIARRMDISPRTVHRHLQNVYRKLGTTDRLSTVLRAQSMGLLVEAC
ncbi:LuxR C-terminal-related transcriptional regulator [Saccharothrix variisporea]|uniref:Regulatory LuxR family protein n=1 Tax=Saccharothrix variisporea TaxID=543527 RepID=A0A495X959_9PSEU|nr:LuxR C-terminal-related transcriptional regulator [Saccharothrix variisporea]RKT68078.1 regulatory LuxR family protein [Saccharothrix variisporea]